ncbi:hypothetical protein QBZ16_002583 [Prototheca wickerhamii]|uniref:ATP-dependent (S)-NAD(P)H-hydrate dehydratase n=1 Tax=Prototheca wickerhamii TaxID=3111 RepID=A0AAD9IIF7_PROWI|nr:hypothetical protein QBZ16_002583 [Prototheca wickerhamii]
MEQDKDRLHDGFLSLIPKLSEEAHKGQAGKIAVVGGCREYTGAPFFSAMSALKARRGWAVGSDIAHVFCTQGAATVVKGYSPELIVHPYLPETEGAEPTEVDQLVAGAARSIDAWLGAFDAVVVGPGLGRDEALLRVAALVMRAAFARNLPLVVDADGLWLVNRDPDLVRGNRRVVLTPNRVEFGRLAEALGLNAAAPSAARDVAAALGGPLILQKGRADVVASPNAQVECDEPGSLRRVGGQGDCLGGCVAAFLGWIRRGKRDDPADAESQEPSPYLLACYGAATIVRRAAKAAYEAKGRAMGAPDVVDQLGPVVDEMVGDRPRAVL